MLFSIMLRVLSQVSIKLIKAHLQIWSYQYWGLNYKTLLPRNLRKNFHIAQLAYASILAVTFTCLEKTSLNKHPSLLWTPYITNP